MNGRRAIVLVLLVVCLTVVFDFVFKANCARSSRGSAGRTRIAVANLQLAVDRFDADSGHLPESLDALLQTSDQGHRLYLESKKDCLDEWGHPIRYTVRGKEYELRSGGNDGLFETGGDDIVADGVSPAMLRMTSPASVPSINAHSRIF